LRLHDLHPFGTAADLTFETRDFETREVNFERERLLLLRSVSIRRHSAVGGQRGCCRRHRNTGPWEATKALARKRNESK
jgi:hypothetical protein